MAINNPLIPGDPYSYDLKWIVKKIKAHDLELSTLGLDEKIAAAVVEYLDQHDPVYFSNVEELVHSGLKHGALAYIMGYYERGDGGANLYYITTDYNDILNAISFITMEGMNKWAIPVITTTEVTPEMFGAYGDGINDDTNAINICAKYKSVYLNRKTYLTNGAIFLNARITSNGAILKKNTIYESSAQFIACENCSISGELSVDGNKSALGETITNTTGINLLNVVLNGKITAYNCSRHGIRVESSCNLSMLEAYNNGVSSSDAGDGIYVTNAAHTKIYGFNVHDNARNGFASTTYPVDQNVGGDVQIINGSAYSNGLTDVDIESVNTHELENIHCGKFYCSNTTKSIFKNLILNDRLYGTGSDNLIIRNVAIRPTGSGQYFYLNGNNFDVKTVRIYDTASTYSSTAFQIVDGGNERNVIEDVIIENSNNGMDISGILYAINLKVLNASNRWYTINGRRISSVAKNPRVEDGRVMADGSTSSIFTQGMQTGDVVNNTAPSESGEAGNKYIIFGWTYDGTAWKQLRTLTGA